MASRTDAAKAAESTPEEETETQAPDSPESCPICKRFLRDGFCGHCGFEQR